MQFHDERIPEAHKTNKKLPQMNRQMDRINSKVF